MLSWLLNISPSGSQTVQMTPNKGRLQVLSSALWPIPKSAKTILILLWCVSTPAQSAITLFPKHMIILFPKHMVHRQVCVYGLQPVGSLHIKASMDDVPGVEQMLNTGAQVNQRDDQGCTPLHWAADRGSQQVAICCTMRTQLAQMAWTQQECKVLAGDQDIACTWC